MGGGGGQQQLQELSQQLQELQEQIEALEGEVDDSGFSAYVSVMDTDGLGVLNAYADDQLSGEGIVETVREQGPMDKVNHDKLIIPGLVGMLRMTVQEEGGWDVIVGPEDAASLPRFLRQEWEG